MSGTNVNSPNVPEAKKVLVAYFSWSGNTRIIANQIKEITGEELFEIQTAKRYPEEYRSCTEIAKREKEADTRPELKQKGRIGKLTTSYLQVIRTGGELPLWLSGPF